MESVSTEEWCFSCFHNVYGILALFSLGEVCALSRTAEAFCDEIMDVSDLKNIFLLLSLTISIWFSTAVFDFHQAVDGLQEVQRQAQEGKK